MSEKPAEPVPCPFCGSEVLVVGYNKRGRAYWVECSHCFATGPVFGTAEEAEEHWNVRCFKLPFPEKEGA